MIARRGVNIRKVIYFQILFVLTHRVFTTMFGLPSSLVYLTDILNAYLLLELIMARCAGKVLRKMHASWIFVWLILFVCLLSIGVFANGTSPLLLLWATRNNFRFFVFFFCCILFLRKQDVDSIFKMLAWLQVLNILLTLYQFFVLNLEQDFLGGIFGIEQGANGYTNIYICLMCIWAIARFLCHKLSAIAMIMTVLSSICIAAMSELKVFYFEFALIVVLAVLFARPTRRTFILVFFCLVAVFWGLSMLQTYFPESYKMLFDMNEIEAYTTEEIPGYKISRLGFMSDINKLFFHSNPALNLFGFGFGNCEGGNFEFFQSNFYKRYGDYNYRWFAGQHWFLETGITGLLMFILFFVLIIAWTVYNKQKMNADKEYVLITSLFSLVLIILLFYNNSIKTEPAYLCFYVLAVPFIFCKNVLPSERLIHD